MDKFQVVQKFTFSKYERIFHMTEPEIQILSLNFEVKETIPWSQIKSITLSPPGKIPSSFILPGKTKLLKKRKT
jgi:hypothetical protein